MGCRYPTDTGCYDKSDVTVLVRHNDILMHSSLLLVMINLGTVHMHNMVILFYIYVLINFKIKMCYLLVFIYFILFAYIYIFIYIFIYLFAHLFVCLPV